MLRFGVDFLWISGSKWTVRLSLCFRTERLAGLPFPPGTARTLCFTSGDIESISGGFFFPSTQQRINSDMFVSSDHRSTVFCQALMKQPKCLRLDSLILSKEGRPVSQLSAGKGSTPHPPPPSPACWCSHLTGQSRWLTHPQKSKLRLGFCPEIRDFHLHAQSCLVKVHTALKRYRDLTVPRYIFKGALIVLLLLFLCTF